MTARAGQGQRVPPHRRAFGPASPGTRGAARAQARRPGPEPPVLSPERRLGRSPGQRWDARGSTDSRVPVTPERAREPAGGNRPYQSPEGLPVHRQDGRRHRPDGAAGDAQARGIASERIDAACRSPSR